MLFNGIRQVGSDSMLQSLETMQTILRALIEIVKQPRLGFQGISIESLSACQPESVCAISECIYLS